MGRMGHGVHAQVKGLAEHTSVARKSPLECLAKGDLLKSKKMELYNQHSWTVVRLKKSIISHTNTSP